MMTHRPFCALLVVLSFIVAGLPEAQRPALAQPAEHTRESEDYRIGPEDLLDISVWNNTAISRAVPVRPDGKISLPLLNDVQAEGLTPTQLRDSLMQKLVDYVPNPEVSVILREVRSFKVSVIGEVTRPGRFELRSRTTVLDILAMASGFTAFAARARIVILRYDGTTVKRVPFNYNKVVGGEQENFFLQPDDIVLVP